MHIRLVGRNRTHCNEKPENCACAFPKLWAPMRATISWSENPMFVVKRRRIQELLPLAKLEL